jgi:L-alanine-DL-glutamate epimerase-like enolase superfamily enzyme
MRMITSASINELYAITRPAAGGVVALALGAIENALLDAKAKSLGIPCYELLGGKVRDRIRVYWSHCATWRINHPSYYKPAITDLDGVKSLGREVREQGFTACKTNIFLYEGEKNPEGLSGRASARPTSRTLNIERNVLRNLRMHLEALRDGVGPDVDILLDLNFNAKTEGYLKILREIADHRHVLDRDRQLQPGGARLHPPPEPASDLIVRDPARRARVPAVFPRAGHGRGDHRHALERRVAIA